MRKPDNFSTQDWLAKARIDIMRDPVFAAFCAVLSCGDLTVDETIETACTDGWNIRINPTFAASLTVQELRFVLLHEGMHIAYQHLHMWHSLWQRDPQGTNIAADMMVNLALVQADAKRGFIAMPAIGVQPDAKYTDMSVQQVYDAMQKNPPPQGKGIDTHDWEGAQGTPQEQAERSEAIAQALRQGEIIRQRANKGAGTAAGVFDSLLAAKVNWRQVLREFVRDVMVGQDTSTWRKPNRRYVADDMFMPSMMAERLGEIVIGFDTSGSCFGSAEMTRFASEVRSLVEETRPSKCHVVYADARVAGAQAFEDGQFAVASLKPRGGGGTNLPVLFDWVKEQRISPVAMVILSDGETPFGAPPGYPVLWALTSKSIRAPHGVTIHIN